MGPLAKVVVGMVLVIGIKVGIAAPVSADMAGSQPAPPGRELGYPNGPTAASPNRAGSDAFSSARPETRETPDPLDLTCVIWQVRSCHAFTGDQLQVLASTGTDTADAIYGYLEITGRQVLSVEEGPLLGDGTKALLLMGAGQRCASCHTRWITVWDPVRQIPQWEAEDGVDTLVALTEDGGAFTRSDSIHLEGEAFCCPSTRAVRTLSWDGATFIAGQAQEILMRPRRDAE